MHPLIECEELAERLGEVKIYDLRWSLTDPNHGREAYRRGHIPGAIFVDLDKDLAGPPGKSGRHPLPEVEDFAVTLGRLGLTPGIETVVYDDMGGVVAARLWWMLRSIGHEMARLLNGGYACWVDSGHPTEEGDRIASPTTYLLSSGFTGVVTQKELEGRTVLDARAPERFRGDVEPVDPKAGHIPGAINRPATANLDSDGKLLDADVLHAIYTGLDDPVVSCGSGVNACLDALAMVVAGHEMPDLYVGSFSEWSRRNLPVETGQ